MTSPIVATGAATGAATSGTGVSASPQDSAVLSSDFETFLRMLTAQVQNQDPLNPLDSTDFAVQLATFSSVEQQVQTNTLLTQLTDTLSAGGGLATMAGYVGKEALVASAPRFDGTPITLEAATARGTSRAELRAYDGLGRLVDARPIDPAGGSIVWDGRTASGAVASGTYAFEVVSYDSDMKVIETSVPKTFVEIAEVRRGEAGLEVKLVNGTLLAEADVTALRDPQAP